MNMDVAATLNLLRSLVSENGIEGGTERLYFKGRFDDTGGHIQNKTKLLSREPFEFRITKMSDENTRIQISYNDLREPDNMIGFFMKIGIPLFSVVTVWLLTEKVTWMGFFSTMGLAVVVSLATNRIFKKIAPYENNEIAYLIAYLENTSKKTATVEISSE